jgi:hypothetical protein
MNRLIAEDAAATCEALTGGPLSLLNKLKIKLSLKVSNLRLKGLTTPP